MAELDLDTTWGERLFLGKALQLFKKPNRMSTREWAETNRFLTSDVSSRPGKMNCMETPWMLFVMECLDNPEIGVIVGKKSAQIAWTETINNWIGRTIDLDPRNIMIAFPRAASAQKFYKEKLVPYIKHTPVLKEKIGSLAKVSHKHIPYDGGFLVLANAGTAEDGKSSVIPYVVVEEPDGVKKDVNNQGDGMAILKQRMKSFSDSKLIYAGTPTDKDFSQVDLAYEQSNKMVYLVPCHLCSEFHALSFDNLKCDEWQERKIDEFYGIYNPETAYYECPFCKGIWNNEDKNRNVLNAINFHNLGWVSSNPSVSDTYGFAFNELLSSFEASSLVNLAKQKLKAQRAYDNGHEGLMKSFTNNSKGEAYVPLNAGLSVDEMKARRLNYPETVVPYEGLILTAGIDVQHNRFAIVTRAWGRNGNSWLVNWIEIFGDVLDYSDAVWGKLSDYIFQKWTHGAGKGKFLTISAASIDSGDGATAELVYRWVSEMNLKHQHIFACKGIGELKYNNYEIFNEPNTMEVGSSTQERKTLAQTMGVNVFPMGAYRAHEEVLRRCNLKGNRDRHYHCETMYGGYEEGVLSCRKTFETDTTKAGYKLIAGKHKEAIDCEKMALHAAYAIQIRNYNNFHWAALEAHLHVNSETGDFNA
jgi:phage terminase large subunit GpA-like protein